MSENERQESAAANPLCVLVDTNVLLNYPQLSDIDWRQCCNSRQILLIICLTVVRELDAKKSDGRYGGRAVRAIKDIRRHANGEYVRPGIRLEVYNPEHEEPSSSVSSDELIVAAAKQFASENPIRSVVILTEDFGMDLRCRASGVRSIEMDRTLRLENPSDEMLRRQRSLEEELNRYKHRIPKLRIRTTLVDSVCDESRGVQFLVSGIPEAIDLETELSTIRRRHPKSTDQRPYGSSKGMRGLVNLDGLISPEDVRLHDAELERFYEKSRRYLERLATYRAAQARAFRFAIHIENSGTCTASDVDVCIDWPEQVLFIVERRSDLAKQVEVEPKAPAPPELMNRISRALRETHGLADEFDAKHWAKLQKTFETVPECTKLPNECWRTSAHIDRIKHGHTEICGTFVGIYNPTIKPAPFVAKLTVSAAELIEKAASDLHFLVGERPPTA